MRFRGVVRVVVTDLDGTLLDEDTYDVAPARPALDALHAQGIPVVLCSSKSRAEMEPLAAALGLRTPFIVENGGAIVFPSLAGLALPPGGRPDGSGGAIIPLGVPRKDLLAALPEIAREAGVRVRSFAGMSVPEVSSLTGLAETDAALARHREWDEPFVAEDPAGGPDLDERLDGAARARGLRVTRGGRFHHLTGPADKGGAVRVLLSVLPEAPAGPTVGLGDAANDVPLLQAVDRPIVMPRKRGGVDPALAAAFPHAPRAPQPGPAGWSAAVLAILAGEPVQRGAE